MQGEKLKIACMQAS